MTTYKLESSQFIPRPIEEAFDFFARADNLGRITPGGTGFDLRSTDREMRNGLEIEYRIRPLLGIPLTWRSHIEDWNPPHGFRDTQVAGPSRHWEHVHTFTPADGGTVVTDEVTYDLPLGLIGDIAHGLAVRHELEWIFQFRAQAISTILEPAGANEHPLTVAVAGATGFVGGAIAAELRRRGHRVIGLSHRADASRGWLADDVELRNVDVSTGAGLPDALHGVDALAIALAFPNLPIEAPRRGWTFEQVDAAGTERLVEAARAADVRHLVYISGAGAAPNAKHHWFRAKWRAETAVRSIDIPYTIIRPTWVYGPRDVSLNRFLGFARQLQAVPLSNAGGQPMTPVFIDDVARLAADSFVASEAIDQVFDIGGPETMPLREVIGRALRAAGLRRLVVPGPAPLIKLGAALLSWLPTPPLTPDAIDFINQPATADVAPLLARMPRRLTPLNEGLATYLGPSARPGRIRMGAAGPTSGWAPSAPEAVSR